MSTHIQVPGTINSSTVPSNTGTAAVTTKPESRNQSSTSVLPKYSVSSSSVVSSTIVPFESKITMDPTVHRRAANGRERLYVAEAVTVQSTIDGGRERVRSSLSAATRLLLIGPINNSVHDSVLYRQNSIDILPHSNENIIDHPWTSWSPTARTQRWKYAGNPGLGI